MADFKAQTLKHRDGRERVVTTQRELVEARFDGFAAKPRKAAKAAASRSTTVSPTEAPKGGPAAKSTSAPAKAAAATQSPA